MTGVEEQLDVPEPEAWQPKDDPRLVGVIESISVRQGKDGKPPYPAVVVRSDDGRVLVWLAWHTVAKGRLAELKPRAGERIGVKYLGTHAKGYENYKIAMDRSEEPAGDVDWSAFKGGQLAGVVSDDDWMPPPEEPPPF